MDVDILPNNAGAVLNGLDLTHNLSDTDFQDIYDTYLAWANIVITGQDHISPESYINFCRRFGEIIAGVPSTSRHLKYSSADVEETTAPKYTLPGYPEIFVISNLERNGKPIGLSKAGLYWHSDLYYVAQPAKVTFLFGKILPHVGGETMFLNTYEVLECMPADLRARIEGVAMRHSWTTGWPYAFPTRAPLSPEEKATTPDVVHPLVCRHPETNRPFLYPGALYDFDNPGITLLGLEEEDGQKLYNDLRMFVLSDRFIYRHKWRQGDILACDNLAAMHCAVPFDDTLEQRTLHRVTIKGVAPHAAS